MNLQNILGTRLSAIWANELNRLGDNCLYFYSDNKRAIYILPILNTPNPTIRPLCIPIGE